MSLFSLAAHPSIDSLLYYEVKNSGTIPTLPNLPFQIPLQSF
jgi:hypothetical protein